jgi:hypothetical protein
MCCKPADRASKIRGRYSSHGDLQSEETFHESDLLNNGSLRQPSHLTFPNHVHRFDSLDRPPGTIKGSESLAGSNSPFDGTMILFHDVVEVWYGPILASAAQLTAQLEFGNDSWIRRVSVDIDDSWARMAGSSQGFPEEPSGCGGILLRRDQEIDRVSLGITRAI